MSYPPGANYDSRAPSNIIVVDGHKYEWFWDRNDLILTSEHQGLIFPMARIELVDQAIDDKMGNHLVEYLHDEDNIEWFVNKHKETATVINNYED